VLCKYVCPLSSFNGLSITEPEAVPEEGHVTGNEKHLEYFEMGHQVQPAEFSEIK
jgi:hypothetical protein